MHPLPINNAIQQLQNAFEKGVVPRMRADDWIPSSILFQKSERRPAVILEVPVSSSVVSRSAWVEFDEKEIKSSFSVGGRMQLQCGEDAEQSSSAWSRNDFPSTVYQTRTVRLGDDESKEHDIQ